MCSRYSNTAFRPTSNDSEPYKTYKLCFYKQECIVSNLRSFARHVTNTAWILAVGLIATLYEMLPLTGNNKCIAIGDQRHALSFL